MFSFWKKRKAKMASAAMPPPPPPEQRLQDSTRSYISKQMSTTPSQDCDLEHVLLNLQFIDDRRSDGHALQQAHSRPDFQCVSLRRPSALPRIGRVESIKRTPDEKTMKWTNSRRALEVLCDREEEKSRSDEVDKLTQTQRLSQRLDRLNLQVHEMEGDGNCQFRSLSHELFGSADYHAHVRAKVVEYIVEHREDFECFLGEDFEDYVQAMAQDRTWGDELTLRAAAEAYGAIVHVVSSNDKNWHHVYRPTHDVWCPFEIFITYISPVHYNAIRRKPSLKTMYTTLGDSFKRMSSSRASYSGCSDNG